MNSWINFIVKIHFDCCGSCNCRINSPMSQVVTSVSAGGVAKAGRPGQSRPLMGVRHEGFARSCSISVMC